MYLGRASRTKETLLDFRERYRVARHSRVFRGLTGSQRTPEFWGVTGNLPDIHKNRAESPLYGELYPNTKPVPNSSQ